MGDKVEVSALVEGGKANGGPPIGPAIGPTGIPTMQVVNAINEKTEGFKGLKVPVTIIADPEDKSFEIVVSTPMTSALLIREAGVQKGSSEPTTDYVGDIKFDQVLKVVKMKIDDLNALETKTRVKTVMGSAFSCGIKIDGKTAGEAIQDLKDGEYDDKIAEWEAQN